MQSISSLFLSEMIAKLEKALSTTLQNNTKNHIQWKQQQTMNHNKRPTTLEWEAAKITQWGIQYILQTKSLS